MYKTGHAFTYFLLKESVANDVKCVMVCFFCEPRHVSMLKAADILNITYDCYSQSNNVKMAAL